MRSRSRRTSTYSCAAAAPRAADDDIRRRQMRIRSRATVSNGTCRIGAGSALIITYDSVGRASQIQAVALLLGSIIMAAASVSQSHAARLSPPAISTLQHLPKMQEHLQYTARKHLTQILRSESEALASSKVQGNTVHAHNFEGAATPANYSLLGWITAAEA
ncbi:hypothetical protein GOP47_0007754 [Adiantum capillus-veneris]|uniref:Uncharacterized protein n=1 Tax=Adiantum capillus-veneris TaxID=13818 RepID=A0A9D4V1W1_ADICA|nr:hypothetical protein GOP47_0007754 [Adiantum capillus-veneris]